MKIYVLVAALWKHNCLLGSLGDTFMTIWVHGTKLTPTIGYANFFYRMPAMNRAANYEQRYHKRQVAQLLCEIDPPKYNFEQFYFLVGTVNYVLQNAKKHLKNFFMNITTNNDQTAIINKLKMKKVL